MMYLMTHLNAYPIMVPLYGLGEGMMKLKFKLNLNIHIYLSDRHQVLVLYSEKKTKFRDC